MSFWPTFLRRLVDAEPLPVAQVELWPANPRSYDDDLKQSLSNEAFLAAQLRDARRLLDKTEGTALRRTAERRAERAEAELAVEAARASAFEQRAEAAEGQHAEAAGLLAESQREVRRLRADRDGLRKQLDRALGYDAADLAAINSGTSQPRKAGQP
jgi:hypothetical protein